MLIATSAVVLIFAGISSVAVFSKGGYWNGAFGAATGNLNNGGPHGFAEILYLFSSSAANNGSAFGGINGNSPWYNLAGGITMVAVFWSHHSAAGGGGQPGCQRNEFPLPQGLLLTHQPPVRRVAGVGDRQRTNLFPGAVTSSPIVEQVDASRRPAYAADSVSVKPKTTLLPCGSDRAIAQTPGACTSVRSGNSSLSCHWAIQFFKLNPLTLYKNPVMFVVKKRQLTILLARDLFIGATGIKFAAQIALWLWFTVLFANCGGEVAEARGKAQADALRKTKTDTIAKRRVGGKVEGDEPACRRRRSRERRHHSRSIARSGGRHRDGGRTVITGESARQSFANRAIAAR